MEGMEFQEAQVNPRNCRVQWKQKACIVENQEMPGWEEDNMGVGGSIWDIGKGRISENGI